MEVSRLTFTNETLAKIKKGMSAQKKGEVLYGRLMEAQGNGLLAQCKTRRDVAELVGYTYEQRQKGYSWVSNLIRRKHVSEVLIAPGEYQYFLGPNKPDYQMNNASKGRKKYFAKRRDTISSVSDNEPVTLSRADVPSSERKAQITFTNPNGGTINFTDIPIDVASELLEKVINFMSETKQNG